jgi:uncharacterized membrane-anchored protein YhcB (DUF1043 family)
MKHLRMAFVLAAVGVLAGIYVGVVGIGIPTVATELSSQAALVLQLDWLQGLIERIDQLLEAVVDLLRTLGELFGGEGGD